MITIIHEWCLILRTWKNKSLKRFSSNRAKLQPDSWEATQDHILFIVTLPKLSSFTSLAFIYTNHCFLLPHLRRHLVCVWGESSYSIAGGYYVLKCITVTKEGCSFSLLMLIAIAMKKKSTFSLRGWGKALYCSGEWQLSFSRTNKRHDRLMEGEICLDWKFISHLVLSLTLLSITSCWIFFLRNVCPFFKYLQNWTYNMLAWKNQKTSRDTRRRASAALKPWWCGEELPSGSVCSWKVGPSIPRVTLWESNSC